MDANEINKKVNYLLTLLAVSSSIIIIGLYFAIVSLMGDSTGKDLLLQILPNILAVLIAFLIVNYFLNRKGLGPTQTLKEEITNSIYQKFDGDKVYESKEANQKFDLKNKFKSSKSIDILGYSCVNLLRTFRDEISEAVLNGTKVRIVIIKPGTDSSKVVMENSRMKGLEKDLESSQTMLRIAMEEIEKSKKRTRGNLELRKIDWVSGCSMIIYNRNQIDGEVKLTVNHLHLSTPISSRNINHIFKKSVHPDWFEYLTEQFERLWERGEEMKTAENRVGG